MVDTDETFMVRDGYDRTHKHRYRNPRDIKEMIEYCGKMSHIDFIANDGTARKCKINGAIRTWKRDPNRVEVPIKYGLYEYGMFTADDISRVLIPA